MTASKVVFFATLLAICLCHRADAQDTATVRLQALIDSARRVIRANADSIGYLLFDSLQRKTQPTAQANVLYPSLDKNFPRPVISRLDSAKKFLRWQGGNVSYEWSHQSGNDTYFRESTIAQHLTTGTANVVVKDRFPFQLTSFQRESNSDYFRDIRDVRIEFNGPEFQRLQTERFRQVWLAEIKNSEQNQFASKRQLIESCEKELTALKTSPRLKKDYLTAQEILLSPNLTDTFSVKTKDSILGAAKRFVAFFEQIEVQSQKISRLKDSLNEVQSRMTAKMLALEKVLKGDLSDPKILSQLNALPKQPQHKSIPGAPLARLVGSIKSFAIGRTTPNFSGLTLKNVNVRGVNFEYNRRNFYVAAAAGRVDYRANESFLFRGSPLRQTIYALRAGYGRKEGNHLILTYYTGRKQVNGTNSPSGLVGVQGISLAGQLLLSKQHRFSVEVAQSSLANANTSPPVTKPFLRFSDPAQQACSFLWKSSFPKTKTKVELQYQYTGVGFQSFTSYWSNATTTAWAVKAEQPVWKRNLSVVGELRKNNFNNPLVLQRYEANMLFKQLTLLFQKPNLPGVSIGYTPSSQYSVVDSVVFENHFQMLTAVVSHRYRIGFAEGSSCAVYNRYYNNATDSGFLYYNADNFFFSQNVQFPLFEVVTRFSRTAGSFSTLNTWEGGLRFLLKGQNVLAMGIRSNALSTDERSRTGYYGNVSVVAGRLGTLTANVECNHFPDAYKRLQERGFYSIGFMRNF